MVPKLDDAAQAAIHEALNATLEQRQKTALFKRIRKSGLNPEKTFDVYEMGCFQLPARLEESDFMRLGFVRRAENLILFGTPGTGKTHLANAIGIEACRQKLAVLYENTASFVCRLSDAYQARRHNEFVSKLNRLDLLILDEFGYVPIDPIGAQLLFRVIGEFYERKSIVITTNLSFTEWKQIFIDPKLTEAIVDRMVHYSHLIQFSGESYRVKHSLLLS